MSGESYDIVRTAWRHAGCVKIRDTPNSEMRSNEIERFKRKVALNSFQRSLVVGMLLGDGHLESQDKGRTYRLKVEHSVKQKEYVEWLYEQFKELVRTPPRVKVRGMLQSYGFATYSLGTFRFYAQQFYVGRRKVVPKLIAKLLDPIALAIWFMDNGSLKSANQRTYIIHALGHSRQELERLQNVFQRKFGITANIHRQYGRWRLYIASASARKFRKLIEPYVIPSLKYKLGNTLPKE